MRFAPYLSEISFAFSKTPVPYTEMAFRWSNDGLETLPSSHLEHTSPTTGTTLPLFFQNKSTTIGLANLPEGKALKGALKVAFTNGTFLDNIFVDYLFVAFLARFTLKYIVHEVKNSKKLHLAAKLDWQIDPLLMNRVDRYTIQSPKVIENQIHDIGTDTAIVVHSMEQGDIVPITFEALGFDGSPLPKFDTPKK